MTTYVLDACAMLAVLSNEPGASIVEEIYEKAASGDVVLAMNKLNLLEVYYDLLRAYNKEYSDEIINQIKRLPIHIYNELSDDDFYEAGRPKTSYRISLADSIALAQTMVLNGEL